MHLHGLGNAVMFLPALDALKAAFPHASFSAITGPRGAHDLLNAYDSVEVIDFDKNEPLYRICRLAGRVRKAGFDLTYATAQIDDLKAPFISFFSGAPYRIGPRNFRFGTLYNYGAIIDEKAHFVDREQVLLSMNGIPSVRREPYLAIAPEAKSEALQSLKRRGLNVAKNIVGIHFHAPWIPQKRWSDEKIHSLCEKLIADMGASVVIFGDSRPETFVRSLQDAFPSEVLVDISHDNLHVYEMAAFLANCSLLVSNDSGPAHLAAACGVPVVVLFGSTDPERCRPLGNYVEIVKTSLSCSPCYWQRKRCNDVRCMKEITVESVMIKAHAFLRV